MSASNWIALGAILVSLLSLYQTRRSSNRNRLNDRTEELHRLMYDRESMDLAERRKADVSARIFQHSKNNYRLKIFNRGQALARNVRVNFFSDSVPFDQHKLKELFPMQTLAPSQNCEVAARLTMRSPRKVPIRLTWDDKAGKDRTNLLDVTF